MVKNLTPENFEEEVLNSDLPVVIDFYADWCMPCRMLSPVVEKLSEKFEGKVKFLKLNTEKELQLASEAGIRNLPTLIFMKDKKAVGKSIGFMDEDSLKEKVTEIFGI